MAIPIGAGEGGAAYVRLVNVVRTATGDDLREVTVGVSLARSRDAPCVPHDDGAVPSIDAQTTAIYAFAKELGAVELETCGLLLARNLIATYPTLDRAGIHLEQRRVRRLGPRAYARVGGETRTASVTVTGDGAKITSGLSGLVLIKAPATESAGLLETEVAATWHWLALDHDADWRDLATTARQALIGAYVADDGHSLRDTLQALGQRVLLALPELGEVRLSLINRRCTTGLDRRYETADGTVTRADAVRATTPDRP